MKLLNVMTIAGALAVVLAAAPKADAVPSLGVGSTYGYVNATDSYQTYWGSSVHGDNGQDGFVIGPSGSTLSVFTRIQAADIYILTTSEVGSANDIRFNDSINIYTETGTFRSYDPTPYYGINLGQVTSSWSALPSDPFTPGNFFSRDVLLTYTGTIGVDSWIFAAADTNGLAGLQAKTTRVYNEMSNGIPGIQTEDADYWVESNGVDGIQYKKEQTKVSGKWVKIAADTHVDYDADTYTCYQGDTSSPKTTSARGWDLPNPPAVPEPSSFILVGGGLALIAFRRREPQK